MRIDLKRFAFYVGLTVAIGFLGGWLGGSTSEFYKNYEKPALTPPGWIFPIVWTVLYILLGISAYIISEKRNAEARSFLTFYWVQIVFNSLWSFFFFRLHLLSFSAFWIALLLGMTALLLIKSFKLNQRAFLFIIPYFLWLLFAFYLNIGFATLN